uniref:RNA-directed RNA polymerase n=1 Tax=Panagrellus redivivus TaxID=6233 RepID=A0A7E4V712_PANRE
MSTRKVNCRIIIRGIQGQDYHERIVCFQNELHARTKSYLKLESGTISPDENDTVVEFPCVLAVRVDPERDPADSLLLALNILSDAIDRAREGVPRKEELMLSVSIISKDIYPHDFKMRHVFPTKVGYYGNVHNNGMFTQCFTVEPKPGTEGWLSPLLQVMPDVNMCTVFDHHRKDMYVYFPHAFQQTRQIVSLKIPYSSIKQVMIGITPGDHSWRIDFTIHVTSPPIIIIHGELRTDQRKNRAPTPPGAFPDFHIKGNRHLDWLGSKPPDDRRNNARCISVHCEVENGYELFGCLDRLRQHIDLPVDYVRLRYSHWHLRSIHLSEMKPRNLVEGIDYFPLFYAIEAMVSRGGPLCDYLFKDRCEIYETFVDCVIEYYNRDIIDKVYVNGNMAKTVAALEQMAAIIERKALTVEACAVFRELHRQNKFNLVAELKPDLEAQGFMRVRKVIVTPSRLIYTSPELIMGHRVLRRIKADNMLRVVFRDENNSKLYNFPAKLIEMTVARIMTEGVIVGLKQFSYIASSSSQLRDHGCYFFAGNKDDVCKFLDTLGDFTVEGISKMMSRIALCFTQGIPLKMDLPSHLACDDYDYEGGADSKGKPYTFSDGCGRMSFKFAKEIAESLKLERCVPSVVQFRFRGYKGILYTDHHIDDIRELAESIGAPSTENMWYEKSLFMRSSQLKFVGPPERNIEVVKVSAPIAMSLNKPLINILDQASEMQGPLVHNRMRNRIFALLEEHVQTVIRALVHEPSAHLVLAEFPQYIAYERLTDFIVTEEPFFQGMLRSSAQVQLYRLLEKMQIRVPAAQGRMMFGRVDDTGLLQYGQVFVQYSVNVRNKYPVPSAEKVVLQGPIMVSKNPNVVAGDARMYEAVDLPCLHKYNDVIIFPQSGPRPQPDEMAGSDLDGDEYSVFWDPELYLERSEEAFDFTADAPPAAPDLSFERPEDNTNGWKINWHAFLREAVKSFVNYISSDSIGTIARAHLANSDLFGIDSEVCMSIARKHSQAVDLPKSGRCPSPLLGEWKTTEDGRELQPEKVPIYPEFSNSVNTPTYTSVRLLGELHRKVRDLNELFDFGSISKNPNNVEIDESLLVDGDQKYYSLANELLIDYSTAIDNLLHTYSIRNEGELFSGKFTALKRNGDKSDDMSSFNTEHVIEETLMTIYSQYRKGFFDEFGGFEACTQVSESRMYVGIQNDCFRSFCSHPTLDMQRKASAYYRIAYMTKTHLSFPWVVADVLAVNRQKYQQTRQHCFFSMSPLTDRIRDHIEMTCQKTLAPEFAAFKAEIKKNASMKTRTGRRVSRLVQNHPGLAELVFFFRMWTKKSNITCIGTNIIDAVMIAHGKGVIPCSDGGAFLRGVNAKEDITPDDYLNVREAQGGLGKHFWSLICAMTLRKFADQEELSLGEFFPGQALTRRQLEALHVAAISTFFPIAVSRTMSALPGCDEADERTRVPTKKMEYEPITLQVPFKYTDFNELLKRVAARCDIYLDFCPWNVHSKKERTTIITPAGTFFNVNKFRKLLEISPDVTLNDNRKRVDRMLEERYYKVKFYADERNSLDEVFKFDYDALVDPLKAARDIDRAKYHS